MIGVLFWGRPSASIACVPSPEGFCPSSVIERPFEAITSPILSQRGETPSTTGNPTAEEIAEGAANAVDPYLR